MSVLRAVSGVAEVQQYVTKWLSNRIHFGSRISYT